ncbi:MAG: hypothetical protein HFG49_13225 [Lachnospiraceae bacterium]|jgi:hypothetical protein|nr:hypothetical protein [Lachnospiraceae bacterium]
MKKKLHKKVNKIISLCAAIVFVQGNMAYAAQVLPENAGTSFSQAVDSPVFDCVQALGWTGDQQGNWYYFDESAGRRVIGWYQDPATGYWYYFNPSDGKMATGWQSINGKEYFFQPVWDPAAYPFATEQERNRYLMNSKFPYGAMYGNTMALDGSIVDANGAKMDEGGRTASQTAWQFTDTSFAGLYCLNYYYGYNGKDYVRYEGADPRYRNDATARYELENIYYNEPFIRIKSVEDGYITGYHYDGSTGASIEFGGEFRSLVDENGTARYYAENAGDGITLEVVLQLQYQGEDRKIYVQAIVHRDKDFNEVASEWLKMEVGAGSGSTIYNSFDYIKCWE